MRAAGTLLVFWVMVSLPALGEPATPAEPSQPTASLGEARGPEGRRLRVGVVGTPPFVVRGGERPVGLSVDVWQSLSRRVGVESEYRVVDTVPEALELVTRGALDVVVGPLSITAERLERVDFTHRYFESDLAILAPEVSAGPMVWLQPFLSRTFLFSVVALLGILLGVGVLLWLAERKANPQHFPQPPLHGVGNGIWMALVTMTTVGYGDRVPVTLAGRLIAGAWMLGAMVTASSLTAGIATVLTLRHLEQTATLSADQLRGRRVATVVGSTGAEFAARHGARIVPSVEFEEAVQILMEGKADAVVFDRPMLQFHLRQHPSLPLRLSERSYEPQGYGFALPIGQELTHALDVALARIQETGEMDALARRWLGP